MNRLNRWTVLGLCVLLGSCGEEAKQPPPKETAPAPVQPAPQPAQHETAPTTTPPAATPPAPDKQPEMKAAEAPATPPPAANANRPSYTVRGEIVALPGIEGTLLRLHHERIATFANREGKVGKDSQGKPGMKPMTMGFARGQGVSFEGLKPADKIEIVFEVNWDALGKDDNLVITKLTKLAPESKLDFEGQPSVGDPKPVAKPEPK